MVPRASLARQTIPRVPRSNVPLANQIARYASKSEDPPPPPPKQPIDYEAEKEIGQRKLQPKPPGEVTTKSTVRPVIEISDPDHPGKGVDDQNLSKGLSHDVVS